MGVGIHIPPNARIVRPPQEIYISGTEYEVGADDDADDEDEANGSRRHSLVGDEPRVRVTPASPSITPVIRFPTGHQLAGPDARDENTRQRTAAINRVNELGLGRQIRE